VVEISPASQPIRPSSPPEDRYGFPMIIGGYDGQHLAWSARLGVFGSPRLGDSSECSRGTFFGRSSQRTSLSVSPGGTENVPRGNNPDFQRTLLIPRETTCIRGGSLLDFRSRGMFGEDHCSRLNQRVGGRHTTAVNLAACLLRQTTTLLIDAIPNGMLQAAPSGLQRSPRKTLYHNVF